MASYLDKAGLEYLWNKIKQWIPTKTSDITNDSGFITNADIPSKTSDLVNDSGFITTETDPTVPSWAKASTKPIYTAAEVGALPDSTTIPSKTSELTNDSGFITTETDPTVPAWAKASTKPSYTASEVGAADASHTHDDRYYTETEADTLLDGKVSKAGDTMTGDLILQKSSSIADNKPAQLIFRTVQTDNNITTSGFIRAYDDHDAAANGTNMVIQSGGNMIIGSGESAQSYYDSYLQNSTGEVLYLTSDQSIRFMVNGNDVGNRRVLTFDTDGSVNLPTGAKYQISGNNLSASDVGAIPDSPKSTITATHVTNTYCTSSATARISLMRPSKYIGILRFNLTIDDATMPTGTADVHIATLSGVALAGDVLFAVPPQVNGRGTLIVSVNQSGQIKISNYSGVANSGFYRALVPLYLTT